MLFINNYGHRCQERVENNKTKALNEGGSVCVLFLFCVCFVLVLFVCLFVVVFLGGLGGWGWVAIFVPIHFSTFMIGCDGTGCRHTVTRVLVPTCCTHRLVLRIGHE